MKVRQFTKPYNEDEWYYIKYIYSHNGGRIYTFWTEDKNEYNQKLFDISRHAKYSLIENREPIKQML